MLCLSLLLALTAQAQPILVLKNAPKAKLIKFLVNDKIQLKTIEGERINGKISLITDSTIQVGWREVQFSEIEYFRRHNQFVKTAGEGLFLGAGLFALVFVANGSITRLSPLITTGNLTFISGLVLSGSALRLLSQHTYHLDRGWQIEVIYPEF